jgi:small subunit ribosomal protein S2
VPTVSMRQLLEAGVHFGHQTRRWNPKMRPYIFAERNGIHIIDLAQTVKRLDTALEFVTETVARGESVLFVGTKKQAQEPVMQEAIRAGQPYVTKRWLGGMLTNFVTIKKRIGLLDQLEARQLAGDFDRLPKKEAAGLTEELNKLNAMLGGIRKMKRPPGAIFIIDPHRERIAVTEANKLEIPVIGTGDTNVDPDELEYIIPANDDAIRAIRLLCQLVADAAIEGAGQRAARAASEPEAPEAAAIDEPEFDETAAADLVAQLAAGGTLSFDPELDDEDLLPGSARPATDAAAATNGGAATPDVTTATATPPEATIAEATPAAAPTAEAPKAAAAPARKTPAAAAAPAEPASAEAPAADAATAEAATSDEANGVESAPKGKTAS